jgi:hypothetical protein
MVHRNRRKLVQLHHSPQKLDFRNGVQAVNVQRSRALIAALGLRVGAFFIDWSVMSKSLKRIGECEKDAKLAANYALEVCFSSRFGELPSDGHLFILFTNMGNSSIVSSFAEMLKRTYDYEFGIATDDTGYSAAIVIFVGGQADKIVPNMRFEWERHVREALTPKKVAG